MMERLELMTYSSALTKLEGSIELNQHHRERKRHIEDYPCN